MDYLIKGGRVSERAGRIIDALGLVALIHLNAKGEAKPYGAAINFRRAVSRIVRKARSGMRGKEPVDFAIAHVNNAETAEQIRERLDAGVVARRAPFVLDAAPVLATHTGFGTVAIAYIEPES
jgi:fatty acid-binding protein DegV